MSDFTENHRQLVLLKQKQVKQKTGLSRSHMYNKMDFNSRYYDPLFPRQVRLGAASVAWVESEIDEWINSRIKIREDIQGAKK